MGFYPGTLRFDNARSEFPQVLVIARHNVIYYAAHTYTHASI